MLLDSVVPQGDRRWTVTEEGVVCCWTLWCRRGDRGRTVTEEGVVCCWTLWCRRGTGVGR